MNIKDKIKSSEYKYLGESEDYKYFQTLSEEFPFDRTKVFTDGKYIYKYSTGKKSKISQVERILKEHFEDNSFKPKDLIK